MRDRQIIEEFNLDRGELNRSLFSRLSVGLPSQSRRMLTRQFRMVDAIGELISSCFYGGEVEGSGVRAPGWTTGLQTAPVTWISTQGLSDRRERRSKAELSFLNLREVNEVIQHLKRIDYLLAGQRVEDHIAVLVLAPYRAQVAAINRAVAKVSFRSANLEIEVNTVDAAQGREADMLVFSTTRSNSGGEIGFVRDLARANVALSRGRFLLTIVGDASFFDTADSPLRAVLSHIRTHPADCAIDVVES